MSGYDWYKGRCEMKKITVRAVEELEKAIDSGVRPLEIMVVGDLDLRGLPI